MKFKNRENLCYKIENKIVWESRSVGVNLVIILVNNLYPEPRILVSKRGLKAADYQHHYNLISGYLDWNETGSDAVIREIWEECGLNLPKLIIENKVLKSHLEQPWHVETDPSSNHQNISLRYGIKLFLTSVYFPSFTTKNNKIKGEVEISEWILLNEINNYKWAFNHDKVIKEYVKLIK